MTHNYYNKLEEDTVISYNMDPPILKSIDQGSHRDCGFILFWMRGDDIMTKQVQKTCRPRPGVSPPTFNHNYTPVLPLQGLLFTKCRPG